MQQCLYLRGVATVFRAFLSPQIASVGYDPRRLMDTLGGGTTASSTTKGTQFYIHEKPNKDVKVSRAQPVRGARGRRAPAPSVKRRLHRSSSATKDELTEAAATAALAPDASAPLPPLQQDHVVVFQFDVELPSMWQTYLRAFFRQQSEREPASLKLNRAHVKTLILDICLEFLKADHLQLDTVCLWTIAPFVCDYFIARYESPALVGCWLFSFVEGLLAFQDDPRVAFFCAASGLSTNGSSSSTASSSMACLGYDVFLYYLHALGHIFFGQMKIFKAENRLEETPDGSCPVPSKHIAAAADTLFGFTLTGSEKRLLHQEIAALPAVAAPYPTLEGATAVRTGSTSAVVAPPASPALSAKAKSAKGDVVVDKSKIVDLDDAMAIFLSRWNATILQVDEVRSLRRTPRCLVSLPHSEFACTRQRYKQAFESADTGSNRIGLDQFIKIVTGVTNNRISPRECRLVFGDVGHEFLDLDTFLRVTRAYQLRLFNVHLPEVPFQEQDLQELRLSVGRTNISSLERVRHPDSCFTAAHVRTCD